MKISNYSGVQSSNFIAVQIFNLFDFQGLQYPIMLPVRAYAGNRRWCLHNDESIQDFVALLEVVSLGFDEVSDALDDDWVLAKRFHGRDGVLYRLDKLVLSLRQLILQLQYR